MNLNLIKPLELLNLQEIEQWETLKSTTKMWSVRRRPGSGKHYRTKQPVQFCSINTLREREKNGGGGGEGEPKLNRDLKRHISHF